MVKAKIYVSNINRLLKEVRSEIFVNFIYSDNKRLLITTNKVAAISNLNIIKKYMKDLNNIDLNNIISLGVKIEEGRLDFFSFLFIFYFSFRFYFSIFYF